MNFFYNKIGFFTLLKREVNRFTKVYIQTILAPLFSNILFLSIFGGVLQSRSIDIQGIDYLSFLVPGLCAMGTIFAAFQNPSSSILIQKYQNIIQDLNTYPLSTFEKVLAFILGGTLRGFLVGILTYIATIYFVGHEIEHWALFIISLIITAFIFSSLGIIAGLVLNSFEKMTFTLTIVLTPLIYFGGVFFEITKLPGIFSTLAHFNPIFPLINLVRFAYLNVYESNLFFHIIFIIFFFISSFLLALYYFYKGIGLKN